jgi:hypothetical protein
MTATLDVRQSASPGVGAKLRDVTGDVLTHTPLESLCRSPYC